MFKQNKLMLTMALCIFGLLTTLACGGLVEGLMGDVMTTDPDAANERGQAIVNYELPAGFSAQMAMGMFGMEMVFIADGTMSETESTATTVIMLAKMPADAEGNSEEQLRQALTEQSGTGDVTNSTVVETREITVNGQPATLTITEGQTEEGDPIRTATAAFQAKDGGSAVLLIAAPPGSWDEAALNQFINSLS